MGAASNNLELKLLDHSLGTTTFTKPTTVYVALFTADPGEACSFTSEVSTSGTGYTRKAVTFAAASSGSASSNATVTFDAATSNWGTITHLMIVSSSSGTTSADALYYGALSASKSIDTGDSFSITSGNLTVSLD